MIVDAHSRDLLTLAEAAARLRQSVPTIRRKIRAGELEAVRVGVRGPLRIDTATLDAHLVPVRRHR